MARQPRVLVMVSLPPPVVGKLDALVERWTKGIAAEAKLWTRSKVIAALIEEHADQLRRVG